MSHKSRTELKGTGLSLTSGLTDLNRILGETGSMLIVKGQSQSFSVSEGSFRHVNLASLGPSGWQAGRSAAQSARTAHALQTRGDWPKGRNRPYFACGQEDGS